MKELFEKKFKKTKGCWIYNGNSLKYGKFKYKGKGYLAHRVSYFLYKGLIPNGLSVLHKCDVKGCVNPDHLFLGTQADNIADMCSKGRQTHFAPGGEANGKSKLSSKDVKKIKQYLSQGNLTNKEIGKLYDVTGQTISSIKTKRTWA